MRASTLAAIGLAVATLSFAALAAGRAVARTGRAGPVRRVPGAGARRAVRRAGAGAPARGQPSGSRRGSGDRGRHAGLLFRSAGSLLVAGAATGLIAVRRRSAACTCRVLGLAAATHRDRGPARGRRLPPPGDAARTTRGGVGRPAAEAC